MKHLALTACRAETLPVLRNTLVVLLVLCLAPQATAQRQEKAASELKLDPISISPPDPMAQFENAVYIDQQLDAQIPLDLEFVNEHGERVTLQHYFNDRPVILALVYYNCPMLCNLIMNGMVAGIDAAETRLELGQDYHVINVSIDPSETPALAREKKANYLEQMHRPGGEEGWHFLTGDEKNIEALARTVGFRYYYDEASGQYAHASGIIFVTPQGRVSSYYMGIEYLPGRLYRALVDAGRGTIGSLVDQLILTCFYYDPTKGTYGLYIFNALRLGAVGIVLAILGFWLVHYVQYRRTRYAAPETGAGHA